MSTSRLSETVCSLKGDKRIPYLYAGRYISGLSVGVTTAINPIYVDEIAEDEVRGTLGIYVELMITVGILWSFIVGSYSPYIWFSISSAVIPVIFFGAFMFMPESPIHLLAAGRDTKAEEALKWLREVMSLRLSGELVGMALLVSWFRALDMCGESAYKDSIARLVS
uniref:Major facilitator superfamily (MFS) profile domain-containing protein n=1 Tax=Timema monikensis TaxID=170555 RepID=A0A7R9E8E6_9NEOP|nr:unnamed protein product [Timema monikensis]